MSKSQIQKGQNRPLKTLCILRRIIDGKPERLISRVPTSFAKKGAILSIKTGKGQDWQTGWEVISVIEESTESP